jgi:hypothetical protein
MSVFSVLYEIITKTSNNKHMSKLFWRLRSGVSVSILPLTGRFLGSAALRVRVLFKRKQKRLYECVCFKRKQKILFLSDREL